VLFRSNVHGRGSTVDSSGPEGRIRGTVHQVIEKYQSLARDATASGDRVAAENFYQHAEHYQRVVTANGWDQQQQRSDQRNDQRGEQRSDQRNDQRNDQRGDQRNQQHDNRASSNGADATDQPDAAQPKAAVAEAVEEAPAPTSDAATVEAEEEQAPVS